MWRSSTARIAESHLRTYVRFPNAWESHLRTYVRFRRT
jgi:hypothetical protein